MIRLGARDGLRAALTGSERKVGEMKQAMPKLQEESLELFSDKAPAQSKPVENKTEKKKVCLINFEAEKTEEEKTYDDG